MMFTPTNKTLPRLCLVATVIAAVAIGVMAAPSGQIDSELGELPPLAGGVADTDSIDDLLLFTPSLGQDRDPHEALCDSLMQRASDAYRAVAALRVNPEADKGELYSASEVATDRCVEALEVVDAGSRYSLQLRETLRDLNPMIFDAAFHYTSQGDQLTVTRMARKYIDVQLLPVMKGVKFLRNPRVFPTLAYIAASDAYNNKDWVNAIKYFNEFYTTPDEALRPKVDPYMVQACLNAGRYDEGLTVAEQAVQREPDNLVMTKLAVQTCIAGGRAEKLGPFIDNALRLDPTDLAMLSNKGKLMEDQGRWGDALKVYQQIKEAHPESLTYAQHEALCYYNIAVNFFNRAVNEQDTKLAQRQRHQARDHFDAALMLLENVIASSPMDVKYLRAAAVCALCMENRPKFDQFNSRITALGEDPLSDVFMPGVITVNAANENNFTASGLVAQGGTPPPFSEFASAFVTQELQKFVAKDEFETLEKYSQRVNDRSIAAETRRLKSMAAEKYLATYGKNLSLSELYLHPYDADNQTFLVETSYGNLTVAVPNKGDEAKQFKQLWSSVQLREAKWFIDDDNVRVSYVKFVLPNGKTYAYDNLKAHDYTIPDITIDVDKIVAATQTSSPTPSSGNIAKASYDVGIVSDVDRDIPVSRKTQPSTYALLIANENYQGGIARVESALHDGRIMAEYVEKTLGVPSENILLLTDASLSDMLKGVARLEQLVNASSEPADVIVYYAGHGMPDETTRDAYLLPVDGSATLSAVNLSLAKFTERLSNLNAASVVTFLDACFSGSSRSDKMLASARAVSIKPNMASARGNSMVLSATTDKQTALPYREKDHGMFTYWLLKKLQESKGDATLKEISDYVTQNVKKTSLKENGKDQVPSVSLSGALSTEWSKKKLKK
ncbi:MAG: caspase family protein [Bacteroidales bacterium]|nr:caspase family protein [Bacteroidales bacterium]